MGKLFIVIKREFLSRVKKPSFIIMTILTPLLITALILAPLLVNQSKYASTTIKIIDDTHIISDILIKNNQNKFLKYEEVSGNFLIDDVIDQYENNDAIMVLHIPDNFIKNQAPIVELFNKNSPGLYVVNKIKDDLYDIRKKLIIYSTYKFDLQKFEKRMNSPVNVLFQGEGLNPQLKFFLSFSIALLLYILILMYGVQVMRGVMEEKNNRIVEIIVSSIAPKDLLKGKIIGIGLVAITQFFSILLFSGLIVYGIQSFFQIDTNDIINQQFQMMNNQGNVVDDSTVSNFTTINQSMNNYVNALIQFLPLVLLISPVLFFLGFYLYASFFAAVGSAMDNESEPQQFILPITLPIIISGFIGLSVIDNPNSDLAFWASLFPLSSPIVMAARLPFINLATDWWQILLCIVLLISAVVYSTKISSRIYKTGILMYGQKLNYRTLWKWFKQSK